MERILRAAQSSRTAVGRGKLVWTYQNPSYREELQQGVLVKAI